MLAFSGSGATLPTQYYTLIATFCQGEKLKNLGMEPRMGEKKVKTRSL
jgi:hypothetical protein